MTARARVRRQVDLERCDAAVAAVDANRFALAVGVPMFDDERHLRRRIERARANDGDPFDGFAGPIDVAFTVDERGVAVFRHAIAGDVEWREIDVVASEDEEAEVAPFLNGDQVRTLFRFRELARLPQSARIGVAGRENLILITDDGDVRVGDRAQVFERRRPDDEIVAAMFGDDADVGDEDPTRLLIERRFAGEDDTIKTGLVILDERFQ